MIALFCLFSIAGGKSFMCALRTYALQIDPIFSLIFFFADCALCFA